MASTLLNKSLRFNKTFRKSLDDIKKAGAEKKYDCVIGVSGGVDSSFLAWKVCATRIKAIGRPFRQWLEF